MITNLEIAAAFDELADLYELDGAVVHRVLAYRTAAKTVREQTRSVAALALEGKVTGLSGIGKTLEEKILTLARGEPLAAAVRMRQQFPPGLVAVTRLPGLGPRRARRLFDELGIDSLAALRLAAEQHRIRDLRGFGERAEAAILSAAGDEDAGEPRIRVTLDRALTVGEPILAALRERGARAELAGSVRRAADSAKDLDVVAAATDPAVLAAVLAELDLIESVQNAGAAGARARTHSGMSVDLKVVAPEQYGNLLQHFTGSQRHNVELRERAVRRGLHISEYGVLDDATGVTHHCATEAEVYALLELPWIAPELREGRGELEAAERGELPDLIEPGDIRGDLHCHTTASDGRHTLEEMALAARERGYEYLAITDHSASHGFGNAVSPDQLRAQIEAVRELNARLEGIELLAGSEVNILPDGSLDYEDDLLAQLDWVMASVHTSFGLDRERMTARIITAFEHPLMDCLGHPTGRKIEHREPYAVDMEALIEAAVRTGTMMEINANPDRRDLNDVHARAAAAAGVPIVINSDAHRTWTLDLMRYGVATARRGWLRADQVANTRPLAELGGLRKRGRA